VNIGFVRGATVNDLPLLKGWDKHENQKQGFDGPA
jgi:hypothetical protein